MTIEILRDRAAIDLVADDWRALAEARSNAFLTPEWFWAAIEAVPGAEPRVAVRRDADGGIGGVLPLVASGRGARRHLEFAGASFGDVFHPLDRDDERDFAAAALAQLLSEDGGRAAVFEKVDDSSGWVGAAAGAVGAAVTESGPAQPLPEVDLAGLDWEAYMATRSRNMRSQLGRRRRKLERDHEVVYRASDAQHLEGDLNTLVELHLGRWAARGGSGALNDTSIAFHRRFSLAALERGWLRLWIVEIDGAPAAAWYGWKIGDRYAYYLAGFDERYSDSSLGMLTLAHTIEAAIADGATTYEMLLGDEEFKLRFADDAREVRSAIVSPGFHPLRVGKILEQGARRAADRLPPETRARVKRSVRGVADRVQSRGGR